MDILGNTIITAASLATAELAARVWFSKVGRHWIWAPYAKVDHVLEPGVLPELPPIARHRINAWGERGDPLPTDKRSFRVLVVGGSAAECYLVDQPQTWPHVVQQALNQPRALEQLGAPAAHVGNLGRSLVTCRHLDAMLDQVFPHYDKVDAVVFFVGASDVVHWLERGAPQAIEAEHLKPAQMWAQNPHGPYGLSPKSTALWRALTIARRRLGGVEQRTHVGKRIAAAREMKARVTTILRECPDPTPMLNQFEDWFRSIVRRAVVRAPVVLVARQPWIEGQFTPADARAHCWSFARGKPFEGPVDAYWDYPVVWDLLRQVDASATRIAHEMGVGELDLRPVLPNDWTHWYDEIHCTPQGCRVIGEAVAAKLVQMRAARRSRGISTQERRDQSAMPM